MKRAGRRWLGILLVATALQAQPALSQDDTALEYRVKAAFLFNFTKFVEWPAGAFVNATTPLTICVLGNDPFGAVLDETVRDKQVNNRSLAVRRISQVAETRDCRILFISNSERQQLSDITRSIQGLPVLTVGEAPEFTDAHGMIRFLIVDGKVRFIVNRRATEQAQLALSSKLLSVAQDVVGGPAQ